MVILFVNSKELLENLILVINSKKYSNVEKSGCNMDIIRQSSCLVVNRITVYSYCVRSARRWVGPQT